MDTKEFRRKKQKLVNIITGSRIIGALLLIPIFFIFGSLFCGIFCLIFFSTDFIDGKLARKYKVQSFLGAFLDATCDKVLAITSLLLLATKTLTMLVPILMEIIIATIFVLNYRKGKNIQANLLGKIKMFAISTAITASFFTIGLVNYDFSFITVNNLNLFLHILLAPIILIQLATIITYALKKDNRENEVIKNDENLSTRKTLEEIKRDMLDTEYYLKYKNGGIKKLLLK